MRPTSGHPAAGLAWNNPNASAMPSNPAEIARSMRAGGLNEGRTYVYYGSSSIVTRTITYSYDSLYRLTGAVYNTGETFEYVYDAVGNRTAYTQAITSTIATTYTYDAANRLLVTLSAVEGSPGHLVTYTWDDNGNLISDGSKTYTYTQANRLVAVSAAGLTWSATYNGDGARVMQTANGDATTYTLDLAAPLVTVLVETQATGNQTYLYGAGDPLTRAGSPLASYDGDDWTYLSGRDGLNSVRQETDADGNVIATRSFDPYGVPLGEDGGSPFGFTGEMRDEATGLVFLRARMYQPELGVFLSKDPWSGDVLRPGSMNRWGYVEGNPINSSDPSGLITDKEALEADRIRNYLLYTYDVIIQKDWGCLFSLGLEGQPILTTIKSSLCCEGWYAGNWRSIRELEQTRDAIDLVATQMRNPPYKFRSAMQGTVTISRVPGAGVTYRAWVPPPPLSWVLGDIVLTDYTFDYGDKFTLHSTIHELGHVWDVRTGLRLSRGIFTQFWTERCSISYWDGGVACSWVLDENIEAPPGNPQHPYAGFSSMEDWAEAFATYVYPYYYEAPFNPLRSLRRQYVDNQIKAIP